MSLHPLPRAVAVVLALAVLAGCSWFGDDGHEPVSITVVHRTATGETRKVVRVAWEKPVRRALAKAHVRPQDGRLLKAKSHGPIRPNGHPAVVRWRGRTTSLDRPLRRPGTIEVVDGRDTVERTTRVRVPIPPPGLPDALQYVQYAGVPGEAEVDRGEVSKELVDLTEITKAVPAHRAAGKVLALTFDDGPDPTFTPKVLAILKAKGVKATFCQIGRNAEAHPELTKAVLAAGHRLCNHTRDHVEGLAAKPLGTVRDEIAGGRQDLIDASDGTLPTYYRPPGGSLGPLIYQVAAEAAEPVLFWSIDPEDWKKPPAGVIVLTVIGNLRPGGIILLHDGGGNRDATLAALPTIIDEARQRGYEFTFPTTTYDRPAA